MARHPILLAAAAVLALAPLAAAAQDRAIRLGRSLQLSGQPLEVTADRLEVEQRTGAAIFSGEVLAVQGDLRLTAERIRIEYAPAQPGGTEPATTQSGAAPAEGATRVERLIATGRVTLVTPEEAIEAQEAVYDLPRGTLEMTGDVLLVQGDNILSGQRFVADLTAGTGQMSGRVRTVIRMD
jgi:lipopolysaccharide export system protein LptA